MTRQKRNRALSLAVLALGFCGVAPGWAAVTPGGDTTVAATSSQDTIVGKAGIGTLSIDGGDTLASKFSYIANDTGSNGMATVGGRGSTWTSTHTVNVGLAGSGTLRIEAGGQVIDEYGIVGFLANSSGTAVVNGGGSRWTNSAALQVGILGSATLTIENGGQVSSSSGLIAQGAGSNGLVTVTGAESTWTNTGSLLLGGKGQGRLTVLDGGLVTAQELFASPADLFGNGTIAVRGAVLDADLTFDRTHGLIQTLAFGAGGRLILNAEFVGGQTFGAGYKGVGSLRIADGVALTSSSGDLGVEAGSTGLAMVVGAQSKWTMGSDLSVGSSGNGSLIIADGGQVGCGRSWIGSSAGSSGLVAVRGAESKWINSKELYIGRFGSGLLTVEAGGRVSSTKAYLGYELGSTGTAVVSGAGSTLASSSEVRVGEGGQGSLTVADGGLITTPTLSILSRGTLRLHVSGNDMVRVGNVLGSGSLNNTGTINLYADAFLLDGVYSPISPYPGRTITWYGGCKGMGGTWNHPAKTFVVTAPTLLSGGASDTVTSGERLLFTDEETGERVGASFGSITGSVSFSAAPVNAADLAKLSGLLEEGQGVLSAWDFTTNFSGGEAMLSFDAGTGAEGLEIWRYSNGVWSEFTPGLFTHDANGIASFTVSSFSGYAVTAAVPEPGTMGLLALGGAMLLGRRRVRG